MAVWLFGTGIMLMLVIISLQLRGLRNAMTARRSPNGSQAVEADLSFAAWLEELESKGNEILQRMESERRAVEQALQEQAGRSESAGGHTAGHTGAAPHGRPGGWTNDNLQGGDPSLGETWTEARRRAYELVRQGVPVAAIAQELGISQGEVQLLVSTLSGSRRTG